LRVLSDMLKRDLPLLVLLCALVAVSRSPEAIGGELATTTREQIRTLTLEGLSKAYDFNFAGADSLFDRAASLEPLHPRPYLGKAAMRFWKYLMGKDERSYEEFMTYSDRTIGAGEAYLDTYGKEADILICLGTIYGYRAFVEGRTKNYLSAAWNGKKSYDYFEDAAELDPQAYDAYAGLGVYHYFSAFLPKTLRWIVSVLGVKSDSDLGLRQVRLAAEKGVYSSVEARYYLAQFLPWTDGDFTSSEKIFDDLMRQYPHNTVFSFSLAVWQMRRNDAQSARKILQSIVNQPDAAVPATIVYASYKLAECCYRLEEFDRAREAYHLFLLSYDDEPYKATSNYRLGIMYELAGNRSEALKYYKRATENHKGMGDDAYSRRKAELRLASALAREDTLLIHAQNRLKSGNYDQAKKTFLQLLSVGGIRPDLAAEAHYGLGETLFETGEYAEAITQFTFALRKKVDSEQWLYPWSYFQRGTCYSRLGRESEAAVEFRKVGDFEDYDFENWLSFRTERELARLKAE
jgi:tetratricopeptide (TPR) repeat protein